MFEYVRYEFSRFVQCNRSKIDNVMQMSGCYFLALTVYFRVLVNMWPCFDIGSFVECGSNIALYKSKNVLNLIVFSKQQNIELIISIFNFSSTQ